MLNRFRLCLVLLVAHFAVTAVAAQCADVDGDGYFYESGCGTARDCNDADPAIYPGAAESCDAIDNDCDGPLDNNPNCDRSCEEAAIVGDSSQLAPYSTSASQPVLAWNGHGYGLVWTAVRDGLDFVFHLLLDSVGQPITSPVQVSSYSVRSPTKAEAWTGVEYGLAWDHSHSVAFATIDAAGQVRLPAVNVAQTARSPSLVWSGNAYGLAWADDRAAPGEVFFTRLDTSGQRLGADVRLSGSTGDSYPIVQWTGSEFAVAWRDTASIRLARMDIDGNPIGEASDITSDGIVRGPASMTWNGSGLALAWEDGRDGAGQSEVYFARLTPEGQRIGSDIRLTSQPGLSQEPHLVWTGTEYGLLWLENGFEIHFRRFAEDGTGIGPDLLVTDRAIQPIPHSTLAWNGHNFAVASHEFRTIVVPIELESVFLNFIDCNCFIDEDNDGVGSACDNCASVPNPDQADLDSDARGNACDNCPVDSNPFQDDFDADHAGDACDNCVFDFNPGQGDIDGDLEGDVCDLDDGLILLFRTDRSYIEWQAEQGPSSWNVYEGDLDVLKATGVYTQLPGSNPLAERHCGESVNWVDDFDDPPSRKVAFSLVTGVQAGVEGSLGTDGRGVDRPNANPCP